MSLWSEEEVALMRAIYENATRQELYVAFPHRTKKSLRDKGSRLGLKRAVEGRRWYSMTRSAIRKRRAAKTWQEAASL